MCEMQSNVNELSKHVYDKEDFKCLTVKCYFYTVEAPSCWQDHFGDPGLKKLGNST